MYSTFITVIIIIVFKKCFILNDTLLHMTHIWSQKLLNHSILIGIQTIRQYYEDHDPEVIVQNMQKKFCSLLLCIACMQIFQNLDTPCFCIFYTCQNFPVIFNATEETIKTGNDTPPNRTKECYNVVLFTLLTLLILKW